MFFEGFAPKPVIRGQSQQKRASHSRGLTQKSICPAPDQCDKRNEDEQSNTLTPKIVPETPPAVCGSLLKIMRRKGGEIFGSIFVMDFHRGIAALSVKLRYAPGAMLAFLRKKFAESYFFLRARSRAWLGPNSAGEPSFVV